MTDVIVFRCSCSLISTTCNNWITYPNEIPPPPTLPHQCLYIPAQVITFFCILLKIKLGQTAMTSSSVMHSCKVNEIKIKGYDVKGVNVVLRKLVRFLRIKTKGYDVIMVYETQYELTRFLRILIMRRRQKTMTSLVLIYSCASL